MKMTDNTLLGIEGQCPRCKSYSGDSWACPGGKCPLTMSPHFDSETQSHYAINLIKYKIEG